MMAGGGPGRIHPIVGAKVASGDPNFTKNWLSGHVRVSLTVLLWIAGAIALLFLFLVLLG